MKLKNLTRNTISVITISILFLTQRFLQVFCKLGLRDNFHKKTNVQPSLTYWAILQKRTSIFCRVRYWLAIKSRCSKFRHFNFFTNRS